MHTLTLAAVATEYGVDFPSHLDHDAAIPTIHAVEPQGDVLIRRRRDGVPPAVTPVPKSGVAVVRGESGGNTHRLDGDCFYDPRPSTTSLVLGVITVPEGGTALLSHLEHGAFMIAPGTYEARRQREQAESIRVVAD